MPASTYFRYAAELMGLHRPHPTDWSMVARMKRIGIEPGKRFDIEALDSATRGHLKPLLQPVRLCRRNCRR